jgi:hypothetical protein
MFTTLRKTDITYLIHFNLIGLVGLWYLTPLLNNISVILVVSFIAGEHWSTHRKPHILKIQYLSNLNLAVCHLISKQNQEFIKQKIE